jgi:hypothetical protein
MLTGRLLAVLRPELTALVKRLRALPVRLDPDKGAVTTCYYVRGIEVARWTSDRYGNRYEVLDDPELMQELERM